MFFSRTKPATRPGPPVTGMITLPDGSSVGLELRQRRGMRRLVLRFDSRRRIVVASGPPATSQKALRNLADANHAWIAKQMARSGALQQPVVDGTSILLHGRPVTLRRLAGRGRFRLVDQTTDGAGCELQVHASEAGMAGAVRRAMQAMAQAAAIGHLEELGRISGLRPSGLSMRDTRSRWGSCTSDGRIMLSWRLIGADPALFRYVAAHELAHLRHMDHSPAFWSVVASMVPDWKEQRKALRAQGAVLHANGG